MRTFRTLSAEHRNEIEHEESRELLCRLRYDRGSEIDYAVKSVQATYGRLVWSRPGFEGFGVANVFIGAMLPCPWCLWATIARQEYYGIYSTL